jgi:hypothetical protein
MALAGLPMVAGGVATGDTARPELQRVYSLLKKERANGDTTYFTDSYLSTLTPPVQLEIARRLSSDASADYASYGALLLVRLRHADEAVEPAARLLLAGNDLTALFWSLRNFDDPCLTNFMTLHLGNYLLHEHHGLHFAERRRAEAYLTGLGSATGEFREASVQASLNSIQARIEQQGCPRRAEDRPR